MKCEFQLKSVQFVYYFKLEFVKYLVLNSYLFTSYAQAQLISNQWVDKYNYERPHDSLVGLTSMKYKEKYGANLSTLKCA